jgi:hypothetical protein
MRNKYQPTLRSTIACDADADEASHGLRSDDVAVEDTSRRSTIIRR